jgi:hypothetical protein
MNWSVYVNGELIANFRHMYWAKKLCHAIANEGVEAELREYDGEYCDARR